MAVPKIWRKIPEHYNLIGKKCPGCSELYFPQRDVCPNCGKVGLEEYGFMGQGIIVTYTIIRTPVSDPEAETNDFSCRSIPYALAIVKLKEGPMLTAQIVDASPEELAIGKEVTMVFRKIMEKGEKGVIQYGYKFRLNR